MPHKPNILIAEDSRADYELLLRVLTKELGEFEHFRTMTNMLACSRLETGRYDVVVYDLDLLDVQNGEGLHTIMEVARKKDVRVLILTGQMLVDAQINSYIAEADGFYEKDQVLLMEEGRHDFAVAINEALHHGAA